MIHNDCNYTATCTYIHVYTLIGNTVCVSAAWAHNQSIRIHVWVVGSSPTTCRDYFIYNFTCIALYIAFKMGGDLCGDSYVTSLAKTNHSDYVAYWRLLYYFECMKVVSRPFLHM